MRLMRYLLKRTPGVPDLDIDLRRDGGGVWERKAVYGRTGSGKSRAVDFLAGLYRIPLSLGHPDELKEAVYGAAWVEPDSVLYPAHLRPVDTGAVVLASGQRALHVEPGEEDGVQEVGAYWRGDDGRFRSSVPMRGRVNNLRSVTGDMRTGKREPRGGLFIYPQSRDLGRLRMDGIKEEETRFEWIYRYKTKSTFFGSVESWLVWQNYLDMEDGVQEKAAEGKGRGEGENKAEGEGPVGRFSEVVTIINATLQRSRVVGVKRGRVQAASVESSGAAEGSDRGQEANFSLDQLSAGERQVVLLLTDIHRRLRPGSLLVVDAPELHQDALGKHRLLEALETIRAQRKAQLLVFTSCQEVLEWFVPGERYSLDNLVEDVEEPASRVEGASSEA